jgi:ABC-type polysaccharide/polyol phosphate export permease
MGYLYSHLFHAKLSEYFPYLVAGMLGWSLISTTVTDMVEAFSTNDSMLKQIKLPYSLYVHRVATRNIIIFFHNLLVFVPVMIMFHDNIHIGLNLFLLIPGLLVIYFNSITFGLVFAMIGARYRDISQLIRSLIQVIFFVTPIMWKPTILPPNKQFIAFLNPAYSLLELIRAPLIGYALKPITIYMVLFISLFGLVASYYMFISRRARIVYWL